MRVKKNNVSLKWGFLQGQAMRRSLSAAEKKRIAASAGWKCGICTKLLPACFQVDHIVPLADGGTDTEDNLQSLCPDCHADKTQKEAIARAKRPRQRFLVCSTCESKLSPYFIHKCV